MDDKWSPRPDEEIGANPMAEADALLRDFRAGRISPEQALGGLLPAHVAILLAEEPVFDGDRVGSWKPVTGSNESGGQFLLVFTDRALLTEVSRSTGCSFVFVSSVEWVISMLPPGHGISFNNGGENALEWGGEGIGAFLSALNPSV